MNRDLVRRRKRRRRRGEKAKRRKGENWRRKVRIECERKERKAPKQLVAPFWPFTFFTLYCPLTIFLHSTDDGYRLTYHGYDFLSVKTHAKRGNLVCIGQQIGTGKESDVFIGADENDKPVAVKFHRLGRTSFRSIKRNRDYHKGRTHASWLYLSRLAALKEFAYMKVLYENGFPVPTPIDVNRHVVVMELLAGYTTLVHINELRNPGKVYDTLMNLLVSLAECGLIHGDFNEFNLMIDPETENIIMIDFPQMVSIDHMNADYYFDRDVQGVRQFFKKRFGFHGAAFPVLGRDIARKYNLDVQIEASGFSKAEEEDFNSLSQQQASFMSENPEDDEEDHEDDEEEGEEDDDLSGPVDSSASGLISIKISSNGSESDDDDDFDGDELDGDEEIPSLIPSASIASSSAPAAAEDEEESDDDDDAPEGETRKERRDRLKKKEEEKKKAKLAAAASSASSAQEEPIVPEPGEEGLDEDTIRKNRIIRERVRQTLERRRINDRNRVKNAFKLQAKRNLAQQTRGWADDM